MSPKMNYNPNSAKNLNLLEIKNPKGNSLLHISVTENFIELVDYLLNKGVNVNAQNEEGNTALHIAVKSDNKQIAKLLLDFRADVNIPNKKNETVLETASVIFIFNKLFSLT
jgi:ankyrin repeat protein